jgi:hypothetical protein
MFVRSHKDTKVTVPIERNKVTIIYYIIIPYNYIRIRNTDIKKIGGKYTDYSREENP